MTSAVRISSEGKTRTKHIQHYRVINDKNEWKGAWLGRAMLLSQAAEFKGAAKFIF
jgi:hypothetical protein